MKEHSLYYKTDPKSILENEIFYIYGDREVLKDRTLQHNRSDICVFNNVEQKEEKAIWRVADVRTIPFIQVATGAIPNHLIYLHSRSYQKHFRTDAKKSNRQYVRWYGKC